MQRFKDVLVAKSSELADALAKGDRELAERIYRETTERYKKLYLSEHRERLQKYMLNMPV